MTPKFLKIFLSTLFSIALWVFVSFSYEYTTTIKVPVKFINLRGGNTVLSQSSKDISLTVKGQGWILAQISSVSETYFQISAKKRAGIQTANVSESLSENSWINPSVQVISFSPATIDYTVERIKYKSVPIFLDAKIAIKEGFGLVSDIVLNPDSIRIYGPQSLINTIESVKTVSENFENIDDNISTQIELKPLSYIGYNYEATNIEFRVQKIADKTFKNVPVKIINSPELRSLELFPASVDFTLRGGLENLGIMTSDSISVTVDFNDAYSDSLGGLVPQIAIPKYTTLINVNPKTLKYIIKQN